MNLATRTRLKNNAHILSLLGQTNRLRIVLALGDHEACVCHLETCLGMRQATISQHLMALRDAGLVTTNREGKNIFYRLANPDILSIVQKTSLLTGNDFDELKNLSHKKYEKCPCPHCNPEKGNCSPMNYVEPGN
jgi:DNA-binding transcriptional ArsR family regulator